MRKVDGLDWQRERLELEDGDFVDLDWLLNPGSKRLAVLTHGLEGHARRPYMAGMARAYLRAGFQVCAMNFRGCSGEPNRLLRSYHIGETGDLAAVVRHALDRTAAEEVMLTGYSLGGNVILKYLAEAPEELPEQVRGASVFSVPLFVEDCNKAINQMRNAAYRWSFLKHMNRKAKAKTRELLAEVEFRKARRFDEFDEWYTAPWHGFSSANDYWRRNSSGPLLDRLKHPVLLVNASDDSFLTRSCYPADMARASSKFHFEEPAWGGHCGFVDFRANGDYYSDARAVAFARQISSKVKQHHFSPAYLRRV